MGGAWSRSREEGFMKDSTTPPPWLLFRIGIPLMRLLYWLPDIIIPPPLRVMDLAVDGYHLGMSLNALADLGVADALKDGPLTAAEIATAVGGNADRLDRVLRFVAAHGIFDTEPSSRMTGKERYRNNHLSAVLRTDHPNSQRHVLLATTGDMMAGGMRELPWGLRTGGLMFEKVYGMHQFEFLAANPKVETKYSRAMTELDASCATSVLLDYPWAQYERFVDIAGAYGSFMASLLQRHPTAQGVLFDQAQVVTRAEEVWQEDKDRRPLLNRLTFHAGDFFNPSTLPKATSERDVYTMRQIAHDWNDQDTGRILTSVRLAMGDISATLVLVEAVILDTPTPTSDPLNRGRLMSDIHMMVQHDGKERDARQWETLLAAAGFTLSKIVQTRCIFCMVEAKPIKGWKPSTVIGTPIAPDAK